MKCEHVHRLLSERYERRLSLEERAAITDHIATCASCMQFERNLRNGLEGIMSLSEITPSRRLWETVHTLNATDPRPTPGHVIRQAAGMIGAAVTVLLVAVVTIFVLSNHGLPSDSGQPAYAPATSFAIEASPPPVISSFSAPATPTGEAILASTPTPQPATTPTASAGPTATTPATRTTPEPELVDETIAENTVVGYFHAINLQDYAMAYAYLSSSMQQTQTFDEFTGGFSDTKHDTLTITDIRRAKTNTVELAISLDAEQTNGSIRHYQGTYIVGLEGGVPKIISANVNEIDTRSPDVPPGTSASDCKPSDLFAEVTLQDATGSMAGSFNLTYRGAEACTLDGTPKVQILDGSGDELPITVTGMNLGAITEPLVLEPGQKASILFLWSNWCPAGTPETSTATPASSEITFDLILPEGGGTAVAATAQDGGISTKRPQCIAPGDPSTLAIGSYSRYPRP